MHVPGGQKILLCQVLLGRTYRMRRMETGASLKEGWNSHSSPDGKELVVFHASQMLPTYVVHFEHRKPGVGSFDPGSDEDEEGSYAGFY